MYHVHGPHAPSLPTRTIMVRFYLLMDQDRAIVGPCGCGERMPEAWGCRTASALLPERDIITVVIDGPQVLDWKEQDK